MKNFKHFKIASVLFVTALILSCSNDSINTNSNDSTINNITSPLIGEWQRNDTDNLHQYKLTFDADNTGIMIDHEEYDANITDLSTSSAATFNWLIEKNTLIIDGVDGELNTPFYINSNGQLFLNNLTNLGFKKVN